MAVHVMSGIVSLRVGIPKVSLCGPASVKLHTVIGLVSMPPMLPALPLPPRPILARRGVRGLRQRPAVYARMSGSPWCT